MKTKYNIVMLFVVCFITYSSFSQSHPFLIVKENMYPELRKKHQKNQTHPWGYIRSAAFDRWDNNFSDGKWSDISAILNYNTLAFILEANKDKRQKYKNKIVSILNRWPQQVSRMNKSSHSNYVSASTSQFNAIIALDVIYNDLSNNERRDAENNLSKGADFFKNNPAPWKLAHYGINLLYAIYKNDTSEIKKWKEKYDDFLFNYSMMDDGSWGQSPGYSHARITENRMAKTHIIDIMEFTGTGSYYDNPKMKSLFQWVNAFSVTPTGGVTKFGDSGLSRIRTDRASKLYYARKYGREIAQNAEWNIHKSVGPPSFLPTNFFTFVLMDNDRPTPVMPKSLLKVQTGASLWGRTNSTEALQGILYSLKKDKESDHEFHHGHQNANSFGLVAYGEHLIMNSGTRYTTANDKSSNFPGYTPNGDRWSKAKWQNVVLIGNQSEHSRNEGNGLIDGLIGGSVEFGTTDAGLAIRNGKHHRTLHLIHPVKNESNGYFIISDEVKPDNNNDKVTIQFQMNTKLGGTKTNKANQFYSAPINADLQENADGSERVNVFFGSRPSISIEKSYKGDFKLGRFETDNLKAVYNTNDGFVRATTVVFPEDKSHDSARNFEEIFNSKYSGVKVTHSNSLFDTHLVASEREENTYDDITFKGKTTFFRKKNGNTTGFTATYASGFLDSKRVSYGFSSKSPISIQLEENNGFVNIFEKTNVTFYREDIVRVKRDGILISNKNSGNNWVEVELPAGRHSIELITDDILSTDDNTANGIGLTIYPNPSKSNVTVTITSIEEIALAKLTLFDVQGREILSKNHNTIAPGTKAISLNLKDKSKGIYFLKFNLDGQVITKKIIKY